MANYSFHYKHKEYSMTPSERGFFRTLVELFGEDYHVFPQVHLESILEYHHIDGQDEISAMNNIIKKGQKPSRHPGTQHAGIQLH